MKEEGSTNTTKTTTNNTMPQAEEAAGATAEETPETQTKKEEKEKRTPSLKIKFTLSTLSRKVEEGEEEEDEEEDDTGATTEENDNENDNDNVEEDGGKLNSDSVDIYGKRSTGEVSSSAIDDVDMTTGDFSKGDITMDDADVHADADAIAEGEEAGEEESMESYSAANESSGNLKLNGASTGDNTKQGSSMADKEEMSLAEDDKESQSQEDTFALQDKESQIDEDEKETNTMSSSMEVSNHSAANNRPARTRSTKESTKESTNDIEREKGNNDDSRSRDDASLDNNNGTSNNNSFSTTSRTALASERDILGFREPTSTSTNLTSSFLDSLSEEQRRVRTRHLPNISGFRRLHKSEIKRDLSLIKKMLKSAVNKGGGKNAPVEEAPNKDDSTEPENMDVDGPVQGSDEDMPSDDEGNSAAGFGPANGSTKPSEPTADLYNVFSLPFIQSPYICTDVDSKSSKQNSAEEPSLFSSPQVVESITAFNPPRPPESVGPKKMHRLHRWERNPQDVEVDLSNYRKTVNRTRQELHKAEMERERIEVIGSHLRSHFLTQLKCMRNEMYLLNQQYDTVQSQCVKAAELLTSKTRNRGLARGSYVMKDVISVLKSRGEKLNIDSLKKGAIDSKSEPWCVAGVGGVSYNETCAKLGSGWFVPGDKVSSPCGIGVVEHVYGPSALDPIDLMKGKLPQSQVGKNGRRDITSSMSPRLRVKLPFGVAYFNPSSVSQIESSVACGDNTLCARWVAMLESAKMMGTITDSRSVDNYTSIQRAVSQTNEEKTGDIDDDDLTESSLLPDAANTDMDIDETPSETNSNDTVKNNKMVSFGAGILPLPKNVISDADLSTLEKNVELLLRGSSGVVGVVSS